MTDAGFFRGTSADQDNRFSDKQKKLLKQLKFNEILNRKVDMNKINLDVVKPWIAKRITDMLGGIEDDVVIEFVFNQLEAEKYPDARMMQINLTGFLTGKYAREFMAELWALLISAEDSTDGIPAAILEQKKDEIKKRFETARTIGVEDDMVKDALPSEETFTSSCSPISKQPGSKRECGNSPVIFQDNANKMEHQPHKLDEIDSFFAYVSVKVHNYSPDVQKRIQKAVFEMLVKADEGMFD